MLGLGYNFVVMSPVVVHAFLASEFLHKGYGYEPVLSVNTGRYQRVL